MASAAATTVSSEILQATDVEELEVTETDAALLRELLEEWENEELEKEGVKRVVDTLENEPNDNSDDDYKFDKLKQNEELNVDSFEYYQAPDMVDSIIMTPNSPSVDETMAWYVDDTIRAGVFDCNIDYSLFCSGVYFEEEATYGCLWQD